MKNFNTLLTLSELKEHYGSPPVGICPLYNGKLDKTIVGSKTGNPIVLPHYKAITSLNISFSPKQAGTGAPSPENIRPISGWDSVHVTNSNESESHDYNITLPETIYGGTVDAVTGEGSKEVHCISDLENFKLSISKLTNTVRIVVTVPAAVENTRWGICSHFVWKYDYTADVEHFYILDARLCVFINKSRLESLDASGIKAYLSAQAAAGTPVQVAYKLATPEPFKINPISIPSLNGINTIYSDADNLSCDFKISSFWSDAD